jgi:hypothetical protein
VDLFGTEFGNQGGEPLLSSASCDNQPSGGGESSRRSFANARGCASDQNGFCHSEP